MNVFSLSTLLLLLLSPLHTFSAEFRSSLRTRPNEPHHLKFYDGVQIELDKLTQAVRLEQPIDKNASFLKDFQNKAVLMNRGLNKARLNILKHKKELDHLLEEHLHTIQKENDFAVEESKEIVENVTNQTLNNMEEVKTASGDEEIQSRHNTTRLKRRKAELESKLPIAKAMIPELRSKVRFARLSHIVSGNHLKFQKHELFKIEHAAATASKYAQGFANPPAEAMALSRDIAKTGLAAMQAPANAARFAQIRMIENELTVLSDLRSAMAKDEAVVSKGMEFSAVVAKIHAALEGALPGLSEGREMRIKMFHECSGRGGSTLVSGESACKELLVLHTPELFQRHLNAVLASREGSDYQGTSLMTPPVGTEILSEVDKNATMMDKNDVMESAAKNVRFARVKTRRQQLKATLLASIKSRDETLLKETLHEANGLSEQSNTDDDSLTNIVAATEHIARDPPGNVMAELAKVSEELKEEDPEGEAAAEEEEVKLSKLEQAEQLMATSKPAAPTKNIATDTIQDLLDDDGQEVGNAIVQVEFPAEESQDILQDGLGMGNSIQATKCPGCTESSSLSAANETSQGVSTSNHPDFGNDTNNTTNSSNSNTTIDVTNVSSTSKVNTSGLTTNNSTIINDTTTGETPTKITSDVAITEEELEETAAKELNSETQVDDVDATSDGETTDWLHKDIHDNGPMTPKKMMKMFMWSAKKLKSATSLKEIMQALKVMKHAHTAHQTLKTAETMPTFSLL